MARKFGKKREICIDPLAYNIGLIGESGIGKSTVIKEVCEKLAGDEGYIALDIGKEDGLLGVGEGLEIAVADEILRIRLVGRSQAEHAAVHAGIVLVDLHRRAEGSPGVGPPGVEGHMGQYLRHLGLGDAIVFGVHQMVLEGGIE